MNSKFHITVIFTILLLFAFIETHAQENSFRNSDSGFNQWYIEGNVGFNRPYNYFTQGYHTATPDFFVGEFGVRYMINEFFGIKASVLYDRFTEHDNSLGTFATNQYGLGFQGVANIGRILKFEEWTNTFNLLANFGMGFGFLNYENIAGNDWMGNSIGGLTLQAKVSPRVTLSGNFSGMNIFGQNFAFDGQSVNHGNLPVIFRGSIGVSVSLGNNSRSLHADYYVRTPYEETMYDNLDSRLTEVESKLETADSEHEELNKRVDDLSMDVDNLHDEVNTLRVIDVNTIIADLINDGYFNIYFDFDSDSFGKIAATTINALKTYMNNNPEVTLELAGYADERGPADYNQRLSQRRADVIAKALVRLGIDESRLIPVGKGEDLSIDSSDREVYQQARRVTISIRL